MCVTWARQRSSSGAVGDLIALYMWRRLHFYFEFIRSQSHSAYFCACSKFGLLHGVLSDLKIPQCCLFRIIMTFRLENYNYSSYKYLLFLLSVVDVFLSTLCKSIRLMNSLWPDEPSAIYLYDITSFYLFSRTS